MGPNIHGWDDFPRLHYEKNREMDLVTNIHVMNFPGCFMRKIREMDLVARHGLGVRHGTVRLGFSTRHRTAWWSSGVRHGTARCGTARPARNGRHGTVGMARHGMCQDLVCRVVVFCFSALYLKLYQHLHLELCLELYLKTGILCSCAPCKKQVPQSKASHRTVLRTEPRFAQNP